MKQNVKIHDQSAKDIIIDFAEEFDIPFEKSHEEYCVRIPERLGSGYLKSYQFDFGLSVLEADLLLKKEFLLKFKKGIVHPLKVLFNREHKLLHKFEQTKAFREINHLENVIVSSTPQNNHIFKIPAEVPICIFSLEINRKLFEEKIASFLTNMNEDLIGVFRDVNGIQEFYYKNYYSLEIAKFITEFSECEHTGFMRQVYLEGKAYEILTHQLKQYLDDLNTPDKRKILRQATISKIEEATKIIKEEIEVIDNVATIAKRVGLNQNTLQNGFQQLYKTTVNEYIKTYRIEKAKALLESSDLNITQITYKVGINSRSYFSKLFKKRYGLSPKHYQDQIRNAKTTSKSA